MTDRRSPIVLRDSQRRRFEVALAALEEALVRVEQLVVAPDGLQRPLTRVVADIAPERMHAAEPRMRALRLLADQGIARMRLRPSVLRASQHVRALLSTQLVRFEDCGPSAMRGYAAIDSATAQQVEVFVEEILVELGELRRLLLAPAEAPTGGA